MVVVIKESPKKNMKSADTALSQFKGHHSGGSGGITEDPGRVHDCHITGIYPR